MANPLAATTLTWAATGRIAFGQPLVDVLVGRPPYPAFGLRSPACRDCARLRRLVKKAQYRGNALAGRPARASAAVPVRPHSLPSAGLTALLGPFPRPYRVEYDLRIGGLCQGLCHFVTVIALIWIVATKFF